MANGPVFEKEAGWGGTVGAWLNRYKIWVFTALALIIVIILITRGSGSQVADVMVSASPSESIAMTTNEGSETVIKGDSYTSVARRIVSARSMTSSDSSVATATNGAKLYAETKLAQSFATQSLMVGGKITYNPLAIDGFLKGFNDLYPTQKTKWEAMARQIKF